MAEYPDTRLSLIVRLKDSSDQAAWEEFVSIYRPVIYRFARHKGIQHADAEDTVQQVFSAVSKAVHRWQPDEGRGRFRNWLHRITHNYCINMLTRRQKDRAMGNDESHNMFAELEEQGPDSEILKLEFRREIFLWAARQIREQFEPSTWQAFWGTSIEGHSVVDVAKSLGKKPGAVYAARGRIIRLLREKISEWEGSES